MAIQINSRVKFADGNPANLIGTVNLIGTIANGSIPIWVLGPSDYIDADTIVPGSLTESFAQVKWDGIPCYLPLGGFHRVSYLVEASAVVFTAVFYSGL